MILSVMFIICNDNCASAVYRCVWGGLIMQNGK